MMKAWTLALILCASTGCGQQEARLGWSATGGASGADAGNFFRYIVSGPPGSVEEFAADALKADWVIEATAVSSSDLTFIQFRSPVVIGQTQHFTDKYLLQSPRRINIAPVIARADGQ